MFTFSISGSLVFNSYWLIFSTIIIVNNYVGEYSVRHPDETAVLKKCNVFKKVLLLNALYLAAQI